MSLLEIFLLIIALIIFIVFLLFVASVKDKISTFRLVINDIEDHLHELVDVLEKRIEILERENKNEKF